MMQAGLHTRESPLTLLKIKDGNFVHHVLHPRERNCLRASSYDKRGTDPNGQIAVASIGETYMSQYVNYSRVFLLTDLKSTTLINKERDHTSFSLSQIKKESKSSYLR